MTDAQSAVDPLFSERFRREAAAIARLRHPNIVNVIDYGERQGYTYIAMELVPAGSLRDFAGRVLPLDFVVPIMVQVSAALDAAHEQGIVHRDVKPANILFQDKGSRFDPAPDRDRGPWVMLADFGIARLASERSLTQAGTGVGTPEYMSPEQAMGQKVDGRSDVYALGVVLFELLTGELPFSGKSAVQVAMQQVRAPLPSARALNPDISPAVEQVINKACAKKPEDRYQTAGEFAAALVRAASPRQTPPSVPAATPLTPPSTPVATQTVGPASGPVAEPEKSGCRRLGIGVLLVAMTGATTAGAIGALAFTTLRRRSR
jgi:serine/threonine-protein kinase